MPAIETRGLTRHYGDLVAVDHLDLRVDTGEIYAFLGPNGAGKTTTIRMLTGLIRPTEGTALIDGLDVTRHPLEVKARVGVVPERSNLYGELSARDNLIFVGSLYGIPRHRRRARADALLEQFGLADRADSPFASLSGGMKRRLTIAAKDMRTYYLKAPLISWGMLFPAAMILAFYLRSPGDIRALVPGLVALTVLFGATSVEAVVIAFEKRIGAMERLVMAPLSDGALLIGKAASGALFGTATGALVWLIATLALSLPPAPTALLVIALGSVAFSLMGVLVALLMREVFDAMAMSNAFRIPMMFLCGVFVPIATMAPPLRVVAATLPLSYTVDGLRHAMLGGSGSYFPLNLDLAVVAGFAVLLYAACYRLLRRRLEELL